MQKWPLLFLCVFLFPAALLSLPLTAADQVTADELEAAIAKAGRKQDARLARQLSQMELSQRLSTARRSRLNAELPGEQSRLALMALADRSAFLALPAAETPATAAPDPAAQDALLARTAAYARETLSRLPDFFATQQTTLFSDGPFKVSRLTGAGTYRPNLHLAAQSTATVRFLAGKEEIDPGRTVTRSLRPGGRQLAVQGVFGPILRVVLKDALANHPVWSHWEQGSGGPIAVFGYDVPEEKSHYAVADSTGAAILQPITAYRGELGLDPTSGAILRLTLIAAPHADAPVARGDILVEYGPVEIGGKNYICPLHSVAISVARDVDLLHDVYRFQQDEVAQYRFQLNDVAYAQYHLFHSEMRLLPGIADPNPPPANPAPPPASSPNR